MPDPDAKQQVKRRAVRMRLTERDVRMICWVYQAGVATRVQLDRLFFNGAGSSRCQRRLTLLVRHRYLDRLPRPLVNMPDVYCISRRATKGLRVLRSCFPDSPLTIIPSRRGRLNHRLAVLDVRVALQRSCTHLGARMETWFDEGELARRIGAAGFLPDGYFVVARTTGEGVRQAPCFLEVERSGRSVRAWRYKLERYQQFIASGAYSAVFGMQALRILIVIGDDFGVSAQRHIATVAQLCQQIGLTNVRLTSVASVANASSNLLTELQWMTPNGDRLPFYQSS